MVVNTLFKIKRFIKKSNKQFLKRKNNMTVKVTLDSSIPLEAFIKILERYRDFTSCYRELKINSLTGKNSMFEVSEMNPPIVCGFETIEESKFNIFRVKDSCFTINSMELKINNNFRVIELSINIKILETDNGRLLEEIFDSCQFKLYTTKSKNDEITEVYGFFASSDMNSAA